MTPQKSAAGAPCHEPRPPIPNTPRNPEGEVGLESTPSVACSGNGKWLGTCPVCRKANLDVTTRPNGRDYWISCWSCEAAGLTGRDFLVALLGASGAKPNQMGQILSEGAAFPPLRDWLGVHRSSPGQEVVPPTRGAVHGWASGLLSAEQPFDYLTERRRLSPNVLHRYLVGWDRDRGDLTFPILSANRTPVYLLRRKPFEGAKMRARGRPRPVYPDVPAHGPLYLVEGEIDALTGRQLGLRGTVALGGKRPPEARLAAVRGRTAAVMFDVGAEDEAERVVRALRAAGGLAWVVRLALLGLPEDADLNDYHCASGSISELRKLISSERRRRS